MTSTRTDGGPWTVARLLNWTRDHFGRCGLESPRLCAEILLAHALECERIHLYTRFDQTPDERALAAFRAAVREAAGGKPIAQLTGHKEFYSLDFRVTPDVLIPRPETEVLVERTIRLVRDGKLAEPRILDVGTGSGCIAAALARHLPEARLVASDLSPAALSVASDNLARHGLADRVELVEADLFELPLNPAEKFDVIVTNPPYIPQREAADLPATVRKFEPALALFGGEDGFGVLRRIADEAAAWLVPVGHLLVEVAYNQAEAAEQIFAAAGWSGFHRYRDPLGYERVLHARPPA